MNPPETSQSPGPSRERSTLLAGAVRVLLLLAASAAALFAFGLGRTARQAADPTSGYVCPMHPDVRAARPGDCPVCGMALVPLTADRSRHERAEPLPRLPSGATDLVRPRVLSDDRRAPAWVETDRRLRARVNAEDLPLLAPGGRTVFHPALAPARSLVVRRMSGPASGQPSSSVDIELQLVDGAPALSSGTVGWVELPRQVRELLVVPSSAVLESAGGPYVLVLQPDGSSAFTPRPVQLGRTVSGSAVVLAGLSQDERVAVRSAFFLDADRRLGASGGTPARR